MNEEFNDEGLDAKFKRFMAVYFETRMGMACSFRSYRNGSVAFFVSAKELARFNEPHAGLLDGVPQEQVAQILDSFRAPSELGPPPPDKDTRLMAGILEQVRANRGEVVRLLADRRDLVELWKERLETSIRSGWIFQRAFSNLIRRAQSDFGTDDTEMTFQAQALMLAALEYTDSHPDAYADVEPMGIAPVLVVHVMTGGDDDFYEMLEQASITFKRRLPQSGVIMNAGDTIELLAFGSTVVGAFATVIVKWLKASSSRKVIVTTKENEVVHVVGYSAEDVEKILKAARDLAVIDTEPKSKNKKK